MKPSCPACAGSRCLTPHIQAEAAVAYALAHSEHFNEWCAQQAGTEPTETPEGVLVGKVGKNEPPRWFADINKAEQWLAKQGKKDPSVAAGQWYIDVLAEHDK